MMGIGVSSPLTLFRFLVAHATFRISATGENREVGRDALLRTSSILFWDIFQPALNLDFRIEVVRFVSSCWARWPSDRVEPYTWTSHYSHIDIRKECTKLVEETRALTPLNAFVHHYS